MVTFNGFFLNNPTAMMAMEKLNGASGIPSDSAFRLSRIYKRMMEERKKMAEKAIAIHKKFCLLDEKGMPQGLDKGKLEFKDPKADSEKNHDSEFEKLLSTEFTEKVNLVPLAHLGSALTPQEIDAISVILWVPKDLS